MPVPMMTPTPKTVRSRAERDFLSECSGSSVSRMDCSTFFVLKSVLTCLPPTLVVLDMIERAGDAYAPAQAGSRKRAGSARNRPVPVLFG